MKCLCIQTELDRLINELNKDYPELNISKYIVKKPCSFTDKTLFAEDSKKPKLCDNFSVFTMKDKQYIQFNKKIDGKRYSYKTIIKNNNLQEQLDTFIDYLNDNYKLQLIKKPIENLNGWCL
jgi:Fe-S-cluster containining protein